MGLLETLLICVALWVVILFGITLISIIRDDTINLKTLLDFIKSSLERRKEKHKNKKTANKPKKFSFSEFTKDIFSDLRPSEKKFALESSTKEEWLADKTLVSQELQRTSSANKRIINNISIKSNGKTTKIDFVLINEYGIFVVNIQNCIGFVTGNREDQKWEQRVGSARYHIPNSVIQNKSEIEALKDFLSVGHLPRYKFFSVVVFIQNNANDLCIENVVNFCDLRNYINSFNIKTLTVHEIDSVYKQLGGKEPPKPQTRPKPQEEPRPQTRPKPQEEPKPQAQPEPQMYPIPRKSSAPQTPTFEPGIKGELGEYLVASRLRETKSSVKKIINNIVIKTSDGRTSQIDHILINEFGIFVVETKNYSGNIYGGLTHQNWLQYIGDRKESFYNPVMQNETHIKRLREVLCIEHLYQYKIYSIVVFVQNNANKIDIANVINLSDLIPYVNSFNVKTMTTNEIESIYHQLLTIKNQNYIHHL